MTQLPYFKQVIDICLEAGQVIMQHYKQDLSIHIKQDDSPVTQADLAANHIIMEGLSRLTPDIPIVSEENTEEMNDRAATSSRFWLVDPLDGTKSFIRHTDEFTVNIALIDNHTPIAGVVYIPAKDQLYYTDGSGTAFYSNQRGVPKVITVRKVPPEGAVVVASRSHQTPETEAFIRAIQVSKIVSANSSLKLCLVAEGTADIYPRFGTTMEWDIAAGHAVLLAAGGVLVETDGSPFFYGRKGLRNPHFIASGEPVQYPTHL